MILSKHIRLKIGSEKQGITGGRGTCSIASRTLNDGESVCVLLFGENPQALVYSAQPIYWSG